MSETVELIGQPAAPSSEQPDPAWVQGACPLCGGPTVSNTYYVGGKGYCLFLECWHALGPVEEQTCSYRRVI
jgi:hypothetical protein